MKDILSGLIGIIAALAIFAGGVIIGAGYLKSALNSATAETEQSADAAASATAGAGTQTYPAGTLPYYTNMSYFAPMTQTADASSGTDVPAEDTVQTAAPLPDTGGTAQQPSGTANTGGTQNSVSVEAVTVQNPYNYDFPVRVWLSPEKDFFHEKNGCGHMDPNQALLVTLEQALRQGIRPCDICFPGATPGDT